MKRISRILIILFILLLNAVPIYAGNTAGITVTAVPATTFGVLNFTITYVSDTQMDLSWVLGAGTDNIMIRAKYGAYPADIPNDTTTPSDGYLVYYGNGASVSDTSMDFNETMGMLYYKAWGQNADGTWQIITSTGFKESIELILLNSTFQIGLTLLAMIAFLTLAYTFKKPIFLWFSSVFGLLWGILMSQTTILGGVSYLWILIGAGLFISFLLLTTTLREKREAVVEDNEPEDIKEARTEREDVQRQFNSIRTHKGKRIVRNKYTGLRID